MPATGGTTLAATMRMVDRIHRDAPHRRSHTAPTFGAGFSEFAQVVLTVSDFADRGAAIDMDLAHLTGTQADSGVGCPSRAASWAEPPAERTS